MSGPISWALFNNRLSGGTVKASNFGTQVYVGLVSVGLAIYKTLPKKKMKAMKVVEKH